MNEGARSVAVRVHSRNSTSATSLGSMNSAPFFGWRPSNGESFRRSGSSSFFKSARSDSLKPVPTLPAYTRRSPS